jgi:hypothetical protein
VPLLTAAIASMNVPESVRLFTSVPHAASSLELTTAKTLMVEAEQTVHSTSIEAKKRNKPFFIFPPTDNADQYDI